MSTEPTPPSLFPDEWRARFGAELQQLLDSTLTTARDTIETQFLQTHPPIFGGVYLSPTIELGTTLGREPQLTRRDGQLSIALWSDQDAEPVLEIIPILHHRLVTLVLRHELVVICADEFERVCGEPEALQANTGPEGTHPLARPARLTWQTP
jgi:hypothetical protein